MVFYGLISSTKNKGKHYEALAARFLRNRGLKIITTNYYSRYGEIDIIALQERTIIFVEVKYRKSSQFGEASEAVTPQKIVKLIKAAEVFLCQNEELKDYSSRFDVIAITKNNFNWIENAFDSESSWI